ncbi:MAG: DUF3347 domain-containing protein [Flammeovirgaceae bacterium]|nr:DUF3347 domain-containing protein [Flammeovirgaceae bacterium]
MEQKKWKNNLWNKTAVVEEASAVAAPQFVVDEQFQKQLGAVFASYVSLKEAFVATDAVKVKVEAEKVGQALKKVDMTLITDAAHNDWMTYQQNLTKAIQDIQSQSEIEAQRSAFKNLSDELYKTIKAYGLGGATAYYEFCPMAFNNSGAYWLSDNATIRNPYFGDKMLSCGSVEEKLN